MFQFRAVTDFLASVASRGNLTVSRLKRSLNKAMAARAHLDSRPFAPSALDVEAMKRPDMFASGSLPLPLKPPGRRCRGLPSPRRVPTMFTAEFPSP